jgi:hypothetical protein
MNFIGVHVGRISCSNKCALFILLSSPRLGLLNNIRMTSCELNTLIDPWNIPFASFTGPSHVA